MYPLWIRFVYKKLGEQLGYTGSVTSRASLIEVVSRIDIQHSDVQTFLINNERQPQSVIDRLFEEVNKERI